MEEGEVAQSNDSAKLDPPGPVLFSQKVHFPSHILHDFLGKLHLF